MLYLILTSAAAAVFCALGVLCLFGKGAYALCGFDRGKFYRVDCNKVCHIGAGMFLMMSIGLALIGAGVAWGKPVYMWVGLGVLIAAGAGGVVMLNVDRFIF